jgi:hypothetical protein
MHVQLRTQRALEHPACQAGQQPTRAGQLDTPRAGRRHQLLSQRRQIRLDRTSADSTSDIFLVLRDLLQPTAQAMEVTPCHTRNS